MPKYLEHKYCNFTTEKGLLYGKNDIIRQNFRYQDESLKYYIALPDMFNLER